MDRKIKGVGLGAGLATITMWLLGFFAPALMDTAPVGLEAAITGVFATLVGYLSVSSPNDPSRNTL